MTRSAPVLGLLLAMSGCAVSSWPTSSYVVLQDDRDATVLSPIIESVVEHHITAGQPVYLLPPQAPDDALTACLVADFKQHAVNLTAALPAPTVRRVQYIATPMPGGEMLRVTIDGATGGSQFFARNAAGQLQPGGPFMEFGQ